MSNIYGKYEVPSGGGNFVKFEDGKTVKVRLMSEPYLFTKQYKEGDPIMTRYAWVVYNHDGDQGQIMELPISGFKQIQALATDDDWGDPMSYDIKIVRTGQKLETRYGVIGSPTKTPVTKVMEEAVKGITLTDQIKNARPLADFLNGEELPAPQQPSLPVVDEVPVSARVEEPEVNLDDIPF